MEPAASPRASTPDATPRGPLAGIRIVDCSTVLAGPYCTMLLADLGAEVVKVEPPEGDGTRGWGPPWVGDEAAGTRTAAYYLAVNRNKRSIRVDLAAAEGRAVLWRLLERADVVVENHRVGGFERLGFADEELERRNPALVHLAISGYGPDGPDASKPGYDFVAQAVAGLMSITGDAEGGPRKVGVAIADVVTGLTAAVSILAALIGRERSAAARPTPATGQRIDVSLLASTLAVLVNQAQNAFVTGRSPGRRGNAHPNIVPYETFATSNGEIAVAVGSERQWPRFCAAIGLPDLATEARFATNGDRVDHRTELIPLLAARFATRPSGEWLAALDAAGIPCGPILGVAEAFASPQAVATGARIPLEHPVLGRVDQVAPAFALAATPASVRTPPPLLGEQTDEILAEVGYGPTEIDDLHRRGVV